MSKTPIQLSDHFTCRKLICFTLPSITMIIFTAIYGVVDCFFVSNYAGKTPFAAVNLIIPPNEILPLFPVLSKTSLFGDPSIQIHIFSFLSHGSE